MLYYVIVHNLEVNCETDTNTRIPPPIHSDEAQKRDKDKTNQRGERERERESNKNKSGYVEMRSGNKTHCNGKFWVKSAMQTVMHVDAL